MLTFVELFAGAGGLGLGTSLAGFRPLAVLEWDRWACDTIRENSRRGYPLVEGWPLHEGDVRDFDYASLPAGLDLVSGGPPCQPFSMGGKHRADGDDRDMFPTTVKVVRELCPRAFIVENVKGLTRSSFANYYQYILLQLEFPEIASKPTESWGDHLRRLQREKTSGCRSGLTYNVIPTLVNAANYGVPQKRERVFIVGFRDDQDVSWSFPRQSHSIDALLTDQWVSGDYWDRHQISKKRKPIPPMDTRKLEQLRGRNFRPEEDTKPWSTVRDALIGIPDPEKSQGESLFRNHRFQPGARAYKGHTGSPQDLPAKTLKAGDHGVPGGENMLVKDDGSVRYFTVRESRACRRFQMDMRFTDHGARPCVNLVTRSL